MNEALAIIAFRLALAAHSLLPQATTAQSGPAQVKLHVFPNQILLTTARDWQTVIVQAEYPDGITREVTGKAVWKLDKDNIVTRSGNKFVPKSDGDAKLTVAFESSVVEVPINVKQSGVDPPISFKLDVMPVFMKAGCNTGSCHGSARGKDGFRLSLFGFDPDGDYYRLTREQPKRRLDLSIPDQCLLIEKATGQVPHTGGSPTKKGDPLSATLLRWLESGAPADAGKVPTIDALELFPQSALLDGAGESQQLTVRAKYSDGTDRDVTNLAVFLSSNDSSAAVSKEGKVTAANRGEAFIMARYEKQTVGVPFIVLPKGLKFQWKDTPANNYIDELVYAKLRRLRIQPSDVCSDTEFIRRVTLDVCGKLPTATETEEFIADADKAKREKLVDMLLARKEFVELWVMKWSELLQMRSSINVSYKATLLYYNWLQEQIAGNVPIDQMVQKLLGSVGGTFDSPATNYYQMEQDRLKTAENVAQVFMGMRIQCAQCHNHPFDRWTMDDYYSFAAFFAQIGRKQSADPRETIVFNSGGGEVNHLVGGRVMPPKFLGGATPDCTGRDRREVLAKWLASSDNPYFAKNLANIVWAHFVGRGIVDQVDDVRISNPPANGPLLDALAQHFTEYKYDFKRLVRDICTSRTYQLSTVTNETNAFDERNFSHATLRRIRAEILLDCITQATETKDKFAGLPLGARAVQIADGNTATYFLTTFGRASRETVCSCEVKMEPNLGQALHLMNGENVHAKVKEGGVVKRLLDEKKNPPQIVTNLYLRCLSRANWGGDEGGRGTACCRKTASVRAGRRLLGAPQLARVPFQSLMNASIKPEIGARSVSKGLRRTFLAYASGFLFVFFAAPAYAEDAKVTYDDHLAPILRQRCSSCHSQNSKKADLDVTSYSALMQGGSSGAVIEPGDADASHLFGLVARTSEPFMPQNADKLPDSEIDIIRRWINGGALENSGSKAAKPKRKMTVAVAAAPGKRPDVVPMPTRMVLEPAFSTKHPPMARSLAASPWAPLVAVTSQRQVLLYNTNTLDLVGVFAFPEGQPNVVRFSRDGRLLLVGGGRPAASGRVVVWDITTGERVFEVGKELDTVLAADISADHKRIALGGPQRLVRVYSTETGELQYEKAKHTDWVLSVEFSPDGVLLATADRNGGLCVWEANTGNEYLTLTGHTAAVNGVAWRGDSNVLASASEDATLRLWEMENGTQIKNWNGQAPLLSLSYTRDARLISCGRDQICRIWNQDGKELIKTPAIGEVAVSVAYSDESNRLIAANWSGLVQVYKSDNAAQLGTLVTNPPTLDEQLGLATQALAIKTKATTPLVDAVRKAEAESVAAKAALIAAQQKLAPIKSDADRVAADIKQISAARAAADAERNKAAANLQQIEAARPSIAEALRLLTEALGKLPNDAKLIASQSALTEQLKSLETNSAALRANITELTTAVAAADSKLKDANAQLEAANRSLAAATEPVKPLEAESQKKSAALDAAQKAAKSAETELTEANRVVARWQDEIKFRDRMAALQKDHDAARKVEVERQAILDKANAQLAAVQATVNSAKSKRDEAAKGVDAVTEKIRQARNSNSK